MVFCTMLAYMSKAFTKETDRDDDGNGQTFSPAPAGIKNYITPQGYAAMRAELMHLMDKERPQVVETVHWAASNGDRSENGDYLYGKKRLREIDRRIRFLSKRLECAVITDPSAHHGSEQIFFGATVTYEDKEGARHTVTIVGTDEADSLQGKISWIAPISKALLRKSAGDTVELQTPAGVQEIEIIDVRYPQPI